MANTASYGQLGEHNKIGITTNIKYIDCKQLANNHEVEPISINLKMI